MLSACLAMLVFPALAGTVQPGPDTRLESWKADFRRPITPPPGQSVDTPVKVELGRMLFFDPRLSGSGATSCASCHNPVLGWQDGLATGVGEFGARLSRHTPTLLNIGWSGPFFHDGRAATLEAQALGPMSASAEMNVVDGGGLTRLQKIAGYQRLFAEVFADRAISLENIASAVSAYERTLVSARSPFDRWIEGDAGALSPAAGRGFAVFNDRGNCVVCHSGWRMTDDGFHDIGLPDDDRGRFLVAPGIVQLQHAFKTPTLRNVNRRAPYMHNGSQRTLREVIDHYDSGFVSRPSLAYEMHPLNLTAQEKDDLLEFLDSLTSDDPATTLPTLPY